MKRSNEFAVGITVLVAAAVVVIGADTAAGDHIDLDAGLLQRLGQAAPLPHLVLERRALGRSRRQRAVDAQLPPADAGRANERGGEDGGHGKSILLGGREGSTAAQNSGASSRPPA